MLVLSSMTTAWVVLTKYREENAGNTETMEANTKLKIILRCQLSVLL